MTKIHLIGGSKWPKRHIIFVHGLGGHWRTTWFDDEAKAWPMWLAEDLDETAVWSIEYKAPFTRWKADCMNLPMRGLNISQALLAVQKLQNGSIYFVTHSLGGLVLKQMMRALDSSVKTSQSAASFVQRTEKVVFLATPHSGSQLAQWAKRLQWLVKPSGATSSLLFDDPHLAEMNLWYRDFSLGQIEHLVLTETLSQKLFCRYKTQVVLALSSDPGICGANPIPVDADHQNICKPLERSDFVYQQVINFLQNPRADVLIGAQHVDRIAGRIIRIIEHYFRNGANDIAKAEQEIAKIASLREDTVNIFDLAEDICRRGEGNIEVADDMKQIPQVKAMQAAESNNALADSRLVVLATQALAIAEAGFRRDDAAMMMRGILQAETCITALVVEDKPRGFLRDRLEILRRQFRELAPD